VPDSKQQENLIAYLDGELTDEAAASVEQTLAEEVFARQEVEKLTRTWELLDLLPERRASDGFAEKTLTAIQTKVAASSKAVDDDDQDDVIPGRTRERVIRVGRRAAGFFVLMFIAAVGFNSTFQKGAEPIDELLKELPLVERLDEYQEAGDTEFLKTLHESGLFDGHRNDNKNRQRPEQPRN
jgi:anti-sigma factor RsiW